MKKIIISIIVMGLLLSSALVNASGKESIGKTATVGAPVAQPSSSDFVNLQDKSLNGLSKKTDILEAISHPLNNDSSQLPHYVSGELIVKFKEDAKINLKSVKGTLLTGMAAIDNINTKYGGLKSAEQVFKNSLVPSLSNVYKFKFSNTLDISSLVRDYSCEPCIVYAEPNYIYHSYDIPNDPYFDQQWSLNQSNDCDIDAPEAWDIETGNPNVTIAIIDSGVDYNHPDLAANIWHDPIYGNPGYDFVDINTEDYIAAGYTLCSDEDYTIPDENPMDVFGHGTHCAGIAGAVTNNGIGIAGVGWNCKIIPVRSGFKIKYLDHVDGLLEFDDVALGICYAADNGANVISMSFGGYTDSNLVHDAINYAYSIGVILVAAAGNNNYNDPEYPAGYDNVIAVAATNNNDGEASFSNYGDWVDVAAPGVDILSTLPNNVYASWSGTSMACPHVAGLAGLILSKNQSYNQEEVRIIICDSADKLPPPKEDLEPGRINALNALLRGPGPATVEISFPTHGGEINGVINIQGSAYGEGFQYFTIEYGKCKQLIPGNWVEILNSTIPAQNGILSSLNTNTISEGLYDIRLTMVCNNGIYIDNIWSVVNNIQNTFYVDNDGDPDIFCTSVREGIHNAGSGDIVFVYNGTYNENVLIWKSINLSGEGKNTTIIDGNYKGSVIDINSDNVVVRGFTLKNIKDYYLFEGMYGCVKILGGNHVLVTDNIITPGELGDSMYGEGVYLYGSGTDENVIKDNIIFYDKDIGTAVGVKIVYGADYNTIYNNEIYGCHSSVSIVPMGSDCNNNIIDSNYFHDLNIGVSIEEPAPGTKVISNRITNCGMWGISLFFADDNLIDNNTITHSGIGIYLSGSGCTTNIVTNNQISYNNVGVKVGGRQNKIYYNNFVNNTQNAYDESDNTWYKFKLFGKSKGNYWDDYTGSDTNGDGIGDTPYNIPGGNNKDKYPLMKPYNGSQSSLNSLSQQGNPQSNPQSNPSPNQQQMGYLFGKQCTNILLIIKWSFYNITI